MYPTFENPATLPTADGGQVRQTQVSRECVGLVEQTEILMKLISSLEDRLHPILRPHPTPPNGRISEEEKREPLAAHAEFLRVRNAQLNAGIHILEGIPNRLEL
jgi:hypothetical protein